MLDCCALATRDHQQRVTSRNTSTRSLARLWPFRRRSRGRRSRSQRRRVGFPLCPRRDPRWKKPARPTAPVAPRPRHLRKSAGSCATNSFAEAWWWRGRERQRGDEHASPYRDGRTRMCIVRASLVCHTRAERSRIKADRSCCPVPPPQWRPGQHEGSPSPSAPRGTVRDGAWVSASL